MEKPEEFKISPEIIKKIESGGNPDHSSAEKIIERELTLEVIEKIIAKVQDINLDGTAYHTLREKGGTGLLEDVLSQGILGQELEGGKKVSGKKWAKNIRKTKKGFVHFNIVGRSVSLDPKPEGIEEDNEIGKSYFNKLPGKTTIIFDMSSYEELVPEYTPKKGKSRTFRSNYPYHFTPNEREKYKEKIGDTSFAPLTDKNKAILREELKDKFYSDTDSFTEEGVLKSETEYGFVLSHRVSPRLFRGIVLFPGREKTDEEIDKELDTSYYWSHPERRVDPEERRIIRKSQVEDKNYSPYVQQAVSKMLEADKDRPDRLSPIYNIHGDLLWPKQMSYEEVKKLVEERDKKLEIS